MKVMGKVIKLIKVLENIALKEVLELMKYNSLVTSSSGHQYHYHIDGLMHSDNNCWNRDLETLQSLMMILRV